MIAESLTTEELVVTKDGATTPEPNKEWTDEVKGEELLAKIKAIVHEGNVRRIIIKNEEGKSLIEIPLTIGVIGAVLLPVWAAIGAIAALVADCTILVEKEEE